MLSHNKTCRLAVSALILSLFVAPQLSHAAPPPASIQPNGQGRLLIIGDSLSVGTDYFGKLQSRTERLGIWPIVSIDDKPGRKASLAAPILKKQLTGATTAIVIALGTNDMISRTESWYPRYVIDLLMTKTKNLPVLWVNTEFSALGRRDWISRSVRFNKALVKAQARWPQLRIADWNTSFTPKASSRFIADGVHLTVSGYKTRATFMVNTLRTYGMQVVDASTTTTSTTTTSTSTSTVPPTTTP
jgi:lysophospholipase L1-like esterase